VAVKVKLFELDACRQEYKDPTCKHTEISIRWPFTFQWDSNQACANGNQLACVGYPATPWFLSAYFLLILRTMLGPPPERQLSVSLQLRGVRKFPSLYDEIFWNPLIDRPDSLDLNPPILFVTAHLEWKRRESTMSFLILQCLQHIWQHGITLHNHPADIGKTL
jgi:hypothetical protein